MDLKSSRSFLVVPSVKLNQFGARLQALLAPDGPAVEAPQVVIVDLEDSVPPERKAEGRAQCRAFFDSAAFAQLAASCIWLIKLNALQSEHAAADLALLRELSPHGIGAALAKVEQLADVLRVATEGRVDPALCFPAIETLAGYQQRDLLLASWAKLGVTQMVLGAGDMSLELGVERSYSVDVLRTVLLNLIISVKAAGLRFTDSPCRAIPTKSASAGAEVEAECTFGYRNGASAKIAIHPSQIPYINRIFAQPDRQHAELLVRIFESNGQSRAHVDPQTGQYIGTPTYKQAQRLLAEQDE